MIKKLALILFILLAIPLISSWAAPPKGKILYFGATWCSACPAQKRVVEQLSKTHRVEFHDIDRPLSGQLFRGYGGRSVPFTVLVEGGKMKNSWIGQTGPQRLLNACKSAKRRVLIGAWVRLLQKIR